MSKESSDFKIDGELIQQGAEARIYKTQSPEGKTVIMKHRFRKAYRHPDLDDQLRKTRTKAEVKSIQRAQDANVRTPKVLREDRKNCVIIMEYIELSSVRKLLLEHYNVKDKQYFKKEEIINPLLKELGKCVARLHANNIIHGDLTTSNMFYDVDKCELILIDFGLSTVSVKAEDMAVDLYVLEKALVSTHNDSEFMVSIIYQSYVDEFSKLNSNNKGDMVLKRLELVKKRGRKRSMVG